MSRGRALFVQFSAQRDGSAFSGLLSAHALRLAGWQVQVAFASDGPMRERYEHAGFPTLVSPHKNWLRTQSTARSARNALNELKAGLQLARRIPAPDLVYVNTGASIAGAFAAARWRAPCLWHIREHFSTYGGELVLPPFALPLARSGFRSLATTLVANAEGVAERVLGGRAHVVHNAVESRFFEEKRTTGEVRSLLGLPTDAAVLGVPGTLRPVKGHLFFLKAAAPMLRRDAGLIAAFTGDADSDYAHRVRDQAGRLGIGRSVRFLGSLDDMPAFYRACDVVCVPSESESFGRTVVESFAVGTPVVASAVGGILETVREGENGLLVPYGDTEALARALHSLLENDALGERLAAAARVDAERRFSEPVYMARIAELAAETAARGA